MARGPSAKVVAGAIAHQLRTPRACAHAKHRSDQPDIKHDRGGLRDIQRLLWLATLASDGDKAGQPVVNRVPARFRFQSQRFLWQVRAHLHLLAGRAQDRLLCDLQPLVARRLGLEDGGGGMAATSLLELYQAHRGAVCALLRTQ